MFYVITILSSPTTQENNNDIFNHPNHPTKFYDFYIFLEYQCQYVSQTISSGKTHEALETEVKLRLSNL